MENIKEVDSSSENKEIEELKKRIKEVKEEFAKIDKKKEIKVISHFDTDGISSAGILIKTLKQLDRRFTLDIIKNLDEEYISKLPKKSPKIFLDLASGSLEKIKKHQLENVFILDHHELPENYNEILNELKEEVKIANPFLNNQKAISASGVCYLFSKELLEENFKEENGLEKMAVLGMIGDRMEKEINKLNHNILNNDEIKKKRGLLIYPSTRPLNRTLEFSSSPFIPNVTGNPEGVKELLREAGIKPQEQGRYKSLLELNEKEMSNLVTALMLRNPQAKNEEMLGDIYLIKFFNKLEDARELSATINACSRMNDFGTALKFVLEIHEAKKDAESVHAKYKQHLVSGLNLISNLEKIEGENYIIIDAKNKIKDTIIGTIASIISYSGVYRQGSTIITMAEEEKERVKVSARNTSSQIFRQESKSETNRNLKELLERATSGLSKKTEVGGHEQAAGALIPKEEKEAFLESLKQSLEIIKIDAKNKNI